MNDGDFESKLVVWNKWANTMKKQNCPKLVPHRRHGFTLTEVLLVLAIIGVIAAMVVPSLLGRQQEAMKNATKNNVKSLESIATQYAIAHEGELPRDLNALLSPGQDKDGKSIPAYVDKVPKDAWGQPLFYEFPNSKASTDKPAIWSSGPNRQNEEGNGDDINNWTN